MDFDNTHIFSPAKSIDESEFEACKTFGDQLVTFSKERKYLCLAANQMGSDKKMCVVLDHLFFNPVVTVKNAPQTAEGMSIEVPIQTIPTALEIPSFPKKKMLVPLADKVHVSAYSVEDADRMEEDFDGNLAVIWQAVTYMLGGVKESDVVDPDYLTIKNEAPKKKPNDKCQKCGKKNKKCACISQPDIDPTVWANMSKQAGATPME